MQQGKHWGKPLAIASVYSLFWRGMAGLVLGLLVAPAQAAELIAWQFNPSTTELEITVPNGVTPRYFILAEPARIVVDLPNTELGAVTAEQAYSGAVRQIRVNQFEPGLTRIVLELSPSAEFTAGQVELEQVTDSPQSDRWGVGGPPLFFFPPKKKKKKNTALERSPWARQTV
ncbi:MAG: AMIN domain-containing protein [Leptolyngbyaceae cyanobacterium SL_7_1]|nr:AMIN domain-containing protein [Leptolyngbyaceae cyanobacterium SL_7_1]